LQVFLYLVATIVLGQVVVGLLLGVGLALVTFLLRRIEPAGLAGWMAGVEAGRIPTGLLFLSVALDLAWIAVVTWLFLRLVNREGWGSIGLRGAGLLSSALLGLAFGAATFFLVGLVFWAKGWAVFHWGRPLIGLVTMVAVVLPAAVAEEIAFRGYILSTLRRWKGWPLGIGLSSVLFSLAHGLNPDLNWLALLNIFLAGLAFSLAVRWKGTLWLPLGFHFAWNYVQGPVLGLPVSGLTAFGVGSASPLIGPALWTGGSFGPEGGLTVTVVVAVACIVLWILGRSTAREEQAEIMSHGVV
jgi:membrane protease YdiL (CAAX protease family)